MKTAIALYDDFGTAQQVVEALVNNGFDRDSISVVANDASGEYAQALAEAGVKDVKSGQGATIGAIGGGAIGFLSSLGMLAIPGVGVVMAMGPLVGTLLGAAAGAVTGGFAARLMDAGMPEEDTKYYMEGIRRGGTLIATQASDDRIDDAVSIMDRYHPVNIAERVKMWEKSGYSGYDENAAPYTAEQISRERALYTSSLEPETRQAISGEAVVPVVEEELQVGKRIVETGRVRVHTHITEVPVQEEIHLREEHVKVERRPANRPASDADIDKAIQNRSLEVTETQERAVINKEPRVVEEVVISKETDSHTETISDTLRRTDVSVERAGEEEIRKQQRR
jgi:uncharacterized protein (TIGR02271 family)